MKINNWIKSEYVMFIGIALLSFVWRVCPSEKNQRVSRPASVSLFIYYHRRRQRTIFYLFYENSTNNFARRHFPITNRTTGLASGSVFSKLVNISKCFFYYEISLILFHHDINDLLRHVDLFDHIAGEFIRNSRFSGCDGLVF